MLGLALSDCAEFAELRVRLYFNQILFK